jgi:amidase
MLAELIRNKQASSREIVEAHLRRIAEVNDALRAVVQLNNKALDEAAAADSTIAAGRDAPLLGVPFTVKDWIETEGLICAAGFKERAQYVPKRDATVVARMRAAGAILLGKTTVMQGAPYACPNNPYDVARTPGGSSSGEAAIIAAGGSPLGLGSDSGGSLRWPAHCCGIATLKPTNGLVPSTGHFPRIGALSDPRTTIGPMARAVDDLALALPLIAGADYRDAGVIPMPPGDRRSVDVAMLRVAWYVDAPDANPSKETRAAVDDAVRALADAGAKVTEARPPRLEESLPITRAYWARPESASLQRWVTYRESTLSADDIERSLFEWDRFRRYMLLFMEDYDVIVCPVASTPAPPHDDFEQIGNWIYTLPYSLTGYPVAVVRCGASSEGLPIGAQIIARPWHDHVALAAASHIERALGGWRPPAM